MSVRLLRFTILALQRQASRELAALLAADDLTPSQAEVLTIVGTYGPMSVREVGEYLICESGSPSRLVQTLVTRGFIARAVSSEDKRASFLTLTPQGRSALARIEAAEASYEAQVASRLGNISNADLVRFSATLRSALTDEALAGALEKRFPNGGVS